MVEFDPEHMISKKLAAIEVVKEIKEKINTAVVSIIGMAVVAVATTFGMMSDYTIGKWVGAICAFIFVTILSISLAKSIPKIKELELKYGLETKPILEDEGEE